MFGNEIDALHLGALEILCPQMTVQEVAAEGTDSPQVFSGSGRIAQDRAGNLVFTLISSRTDLPVGCPSVGPGMHLRKGTIPRQAPLCLRANDANGQEWHSQSVNAVFSAAHGQPIVLTGTLGLINSPGPYEGAHTIWITTYEPVNLPSNASYSVATKVDGLEVSGNCSFNALRLEPLGRSILAYEEDGVQRMMIELAGHGAGRAELERTLNTMSFLTGSIIHPATLRFIQGDVEGTVLHSRPLPAIGHWLQPPLPLQKYHFPIGFLELAEAFHRALLDDPKATKLWSRAGNVLRASDTQSLRSFLLTLVTSIEGMVGDLFDIPRSVAGEESDPPSDLLDCIAILDVFDDIKDRLRTVVHSVFRTNIPQRLTYLGQQGKVHLRLIPVWKDARPHLAHGSTKPAKKTVNESVLLNEMLTLYYMVVFAAIDYKGVFWDFTDQQMVAYPIGTPVETVAALAKLGKRSPETQT